MKRTHKSLGRLVSTISELVLFSVVVLFFSTGATLWAAVYTWNNPLGGNWADDANWDSAPGFPDDATDNALVNLLASPFAITLPSGTISINSLNLSSDNGVLQIDSGRVFTLGADSANDGLILLNDINAPSPDTDQASLRITSNVTLSGTGVVRFNTPNRNTIGDFSVLNQVLTLGADQTIDTASGAKGDIFNALVNNGVLDANAGIINLHTRNKTNNNLMRARNGGNLNVSGVTIENSNRLILIDPVSQLSLSSGAVAGTIRGGTIHGGGVINIGFAGGTFDGLTPDGLTLNNVSVNVDVVSGSIGKTLILRGTIVNNGIIRLNDDNPIIFQDALLWVNSADLFLNGTGSIQFMSANQNRIESVLSTNVLHIGASQTISAGVGKVGVLASRLVNQGTIRVDGSISATGDFLVNDETGLITGGGMLNVTATTFTNEGTVSPGNSPGELNIIGDYNQILPGNLLIEIAGNLFGDPLIGYDRLVISGNANLGGKLNVTFLSGFIPSVNDEFVVLKTTGVSSVVNNQFSNALSSLWVPGGRFEVLYLPNQVVLKNFQVPEPAGVTMLGIFGWSLIFGRICRPRS